jgi:hypothetical protein
MENLSILRFFYRSSPHTTWYISYSWIYFRNAWFSSLNRIIGMCSNISHIYFGFSLSYFVYMFSKWDITTYLTTMKYSTVIPSSKWISLNVFLFLLAWDCLWKKVAFLYPSLNHKLWDFYLQYSSYFLKQTCNL